MGEETGSLGKRRKKTVKNKASLSKSDNLEGANSDKKMKQVSRNKKRKDTELNEVEEAHAVASTSRDDVYEGGSSGGLSDRKRNKLKKKKRDKENRKDGVREYVPHSNGGDGDDSNQQSDNLDDALSSDKKLKKVARNKKRKSTELPDAETPEIVVSISPDDVNEGKNSEISNKKRNKSKKKKREKENRKKVGVCESVPHSNEVGRDSNQQSGKSKSVSQTELDATLLDDDDDEVYQISSGDEDETTGMKKWIAKYHRARPGTEVLLEQINDFLVDYWAEKEKERKEREDEAAEGGWTVVTHTKGRKKTTEAESGTTVGSVAQAAVMDKMSKKNNKQVGLNFYRFQKREAQRNEIMMLQSKFEQDKKRIQQLRAARKFRPY